MSKSIYIILTVFLLAFGTNADSQLYKTVKIEDVEKILSSNNDTLYVLNFWATWCGPCIKEMPYFDEAFEKNSDKKIRLIFISLDFEEDVKKRLKPFLMKRDIKGEVWHLDEDKPNDYIPKIEDEWSGALPFTVLYRGGKDIRFWKEGAFTKEEITKRIEDALH